MEKLSLTENVRFLWNDVACLNDDNCSFIVCKSMLKLPEECPEIGLLERIEVKEISKGFDNQDGEVTIKGNILVATIYETEEGGREEIAFIVPYSGEYHGTLERSNTPQVSYINGQAVGYDSIMLETVIAIPNSSGLVRSSEVVLGNFNHKQMIRLEDQWPDIHQIIGTQVSYEVEHFEVDQAGVLHIDGNQDIGVLYAGHNTGGEKVILHQGSEPFRVAIPLAVRITEFAQIDVGYSTLTAQIINEKEVQISGYCQVRASGDPLDLPVGQSLAAETFAMEGQKSVMASIAQNNEPNFEQLESVAESAAPQSIEQAVEQPVVATQPASASNSTAGRPITGQQGNQAMRPNFNSCPNAGRNRTSRREQLSKHMRNLDRGVRTPQSTKNIDFNQNAMQQQDSQEPNQ